jgi:hypothetical protein
MAMADFECQQMGTQGRTYILNGQVEISPRRFTDQNGYMLNADTHYPAQGTIYGYVIHAFTGVPGDMRTTQDNIDTFRHELAHVVGEMSEADAVATAYRCR